MSQYTSTRVRLRVSRIALAVDAAALGIQRFAQRCAALGDADLALVPTSNELRAALNGLPASGAEIGHVPVELVCLAQAYELPGLGERLLVAADFETLIDALATDELSAVHAAFSESLSEMGFHVEERHTQDSSMIRASSGDGDVVVAFEVGSDSGIELEMGGCADDACVPVQAELVNRVAGRGFLVDMERANINRHRDVRGGALFARWHAAERRHGADARRAAHRQRGVVR